MLSVPYQEAYQLAYLLIGEVEGAAQALQGTLRLAESPLETFWAELVRAALRQARDLPPERFFLRSLSAPEGALRQVDSLPLLERTALVLDASGRLTPAQIAGLLHLAPPDLDRLLQRLWAPIGLEPSQLWAHLKASVPPIPPGLADPAGPKQSEEAPTGAMARPSRRWVAIPALLGAVSVALFVLSRWQAGQGAPMDGTSSPPPPPSITESSPVDLPSMPSDLKTTFIPPPLDSKPTPGAPPLDLSEFQPGEVIRLTESGLPPLPENNVGLVAGKLFQWFGEATQVGLAPDADATDSPVTLYLHFVNDRVLWVLADLQCLRRAEDCDVVVGGEGRTPIRLYQVDLSRWVVARAWHSDLQPEAPLLSLRSNSERRLTEAEVLAQASIDKSPEYILDGIWSNDSLLQLKENDRWRTVRHPAWQVQFRHKEQRLLGEILIYDDLTGALLRRFPTEFGR